MSEDVLPLREEPLSVSMGLDIEEHDQEGRVITAEYPDFYGMLSAPSLHVTACRRPCTLLLDLVCCAPEHI